MHQSGLIILAFFLGSLSISAHAEEKTDKKIVKTVEFKLIGDEKLSVEERLKILKQDQLDTFQPFLRANDVTKDLKSLEEKLRQQETDLRVFEERLKLIAQQDKRIEDLQSQQNIYFGVLALLFTIGGFFTYRQSTLKVNEAIATNKKQLEESEQRAEAMLSKIEEHEKAARASSDNLRSLEKKLTPEEKLDLAADVKRVEKIRRKDRTGEDWFSLGIFVATKEDPDFNEALKYFTTAECLAADDFRLVHSLYGKGWSLSKLGLFDHALVVFDDLESRFGDSDRPELQEAVAKALVGKGYAYYQLGRYEESIEVSINAEKLYGASKRMELQVPLALALFNKADALHALERADEAMAAVEEFEERYSDSDHPKIIETLAEAQELKQKILDQNGGKKDR